MRFTFFYPGSSQVNPLLAQQKCTGGAEEAGAVKTGPGNLTQILILTLTP